MTVNLVYTAIFFVIATFGLFVAYSGRDTALFSITARHSTLPITNAEGESPTIAAMREKLRPVALNATRKHQFLHLHHMKTGGTSMDGLLHCAMRRYGEKMQYQNLHECSRSHYERCRDGEDNLCLKNTRQSTILSFCAPLSDLPTFHWHKSHAAVTVLRNPVDRVWSMFRFQTRSCYDCRPLLEHLQEIKAGTSELSKTCKQQLVNHQSTNLVSLQHEGTPEERLENAIDNMKSFFTMIGLTDNLELSIEMARRVFPWMALQYNNETCELDHLNASPKNNRCGPDNTHWDLPPHPDVETRNAITEMNDLDMKLYEAATEQFTLQREALGL